MSELETWRVREGGGRICLMLSEENARKKKIKTQQFPLSQETLFTDDDLQNNQIWVKVQKIKISLKESHPLRNLMYSFCASDQQRCPVGFLDMSLDWLFSC